MTIYYKCAILIFGEVNNVIKKIIGIIIILFLIISFIEPIIAKNDSRFLEETLVLGYILDQSSTTYDNAAWAISGCYLTAQSFKPTISSLVKVDIFCSYTGDEGNLHESQGFYLYQR